MSVTRPPRRKRPLQPQAQLDLDTPQAPLTAAHAKKRKPHKQFSSLPPPKQPDLFTHPLPPLPRHHLNAQEIRLTRVSVGNIAHGRSEKEQWLYLSTTEHNATDYLSHGIPLSHTHPLLLTTLEGVRAWLAKLHEQEDHEQLEEMCLLRLHKSMIADLLEPEPDQSARFSAPFFWLKKV